MDTVLVVGVETVAGANLALEFAQRFRVFGLTSQANLHLDRCSVQLIQAHDAATINSQLLQTRPKWVVFCGQASQSCWEESATVGMDDSAAPAWAKAAKDHQAAFTFISSDGVFTGPWISHCEDDEEHHCPTTQAQRIRQVEQSVLDAHSDALVVRTHTFGWSPLTASLGLTDRLLQQLEQQAELSMDSLRHASPILASDLAGMLLRAFDAEVCGLLHIAGGERTNPYFFAELLAEAAGLPRPNYEWIDELLDPAAGFGRSETTLNCAQARDLLEVPMPLLIDGVNRLIAQRSNGHLESLRAAPLATSKAA